MSTTDNFLVGAWKLVFFEITFSDGRVLQPFGPEPKGLIVYTETGWMSVHLMDPRRPLLASGDPYTSTPEEIQSAYLGFAGYFGRYTLDTEAGNVTHHLEGAHNPNWVGGDQKRFYNIEGNRVTLTTPPTQEHGDETRGRLIWEKAG